jgi:ligand-binding sensor domain-containing protein
VGVRGWVRAVRVWVRACVALTAGVALAQDHGQAHADALGGLAAAVRSCDERGVRQGLWSLSDSQATEMLSLLPQLGLADPWLEAQLLARIGGREASALGLALLGTERQEPEALMLRADLEAARGDFSGALRLDREAETRLGPDAAPELRYHAAARLTELYLFHTRTLERALPYLRESIALAHALGQEEEIDHLQELQQLFALEYSRMKARPDALRFQPVESHRGLLGSDARALVRQGEGIWVLDSGGAAFYDGLAWKAFPAEQVFGYTALLGSDGALYATPMNGGLARLASGRWTVLEEPKGYEANPVRSLLERDGWLYLAGGRRLARMPMGGGPLEVLPTQLKGAIRRIDLLDGRLVVTAAGGVDVDGPEGFHDLGLKRALPPDTSIGGSLVDGSVVWAATQRGVLRWENGETRHYTVANGLPANELTRVLRTEDGLLFASSTLSAVLALFDGEAWQSASEPLSAIAIERVPDTLLVATEAGLYRGRSERWRILDSHSGLLGDQIEYVVRLGDETWLLAQNKGVMRVGARGVEAWSAQDGLPPLTHFLAMARRGEQRWLGTQKGLYRLEGDHFTGVPLVGAEGSSEIFSLCPVGADELLVGTTEGLLVLTAAGEAKPVSLPSPVARAITEVGQDRFVVATEGSGAVLLERTAPGAFRVEQVWNRQAGLCSDQAQAVLAQGGGELWVGTDSGLAHSVPGRDGSTHWECLTEANGLPGHDVTAITRLASGRLAVGFYLVGVGLFDGATWSLFGPADGLPAATVWSLAEREPELLWAGTGQGVWEVRLDAPSPLTDVEVGGVLYGRGAGGGPCALGRTMKSGEAAPAMKLRVGLRDYAPFEAAAGSGCEGGRPAGRLELRESPEVRALGQTRWGFEDPESLWYSVAVDGAEAGPFRQGTALSLPALADGLHRLEVRAKNRWLQTDPAPLVLELDLDRPMSGWVLAGIGGGAVLGLFLLRRQIRDAYWRVRHMSYRPIPANPYTPKAPASGALLVGRDELLHAWLAPAGRPEAHAESRLVLGPLSLGKTSLLRELYAKAAPGHRAVWMDLADWQQESFAAFVEALREKLGAGEPGAGSAAAADEERRDMPGGSPLRQLDRDLERLGRLEPPPRVFVLVDNFQLLDPLLAMSDTPLQQVLAALRSLLQRHRHLSLILALGGEESLLKNRYGELFFFSSVDALRPLGAEAAARLCTEPLAGKVYLAPAAVELSVRLSGGHPILLQLVLHTLVEEMKKAKTNVCSVAFVRGLLPALLDGAQVLEAWWQGLTRPQQLVLSRMAEEVPEGGRLSVQGFAERESNRMGLLPQEARQALGALREGLLLLGDESEAAFSAELFHAWVRARQPFQSVLERERVQMGPYELISKIGQGGMGTVFRARHLTGGDVVAVKVLHGGALDDAESRQRFFREAEIGIRLRHNNIVAIYEKGEHGEQAYLAMEFLQGTTLRSYIQDKGPMRGTNAIKILRAVTDALRAIHELGVIHRDIKSENIFLAIPEGTKKAVPKLMDFGLARSESSRVTRTGVIVGTVAYMSPEQATGGKLGPATDLYSLGVVLFEMLTGQMPFTGPSDVAVLSQVVHRPPPDIRQLRPDISEGLAALLERLLAKESALRPGSAAEMVALLDEMLEASGAQEPDAASAQKG